jgi:hypothetical protein
MKKLLILTAALLSANLINAAGDVTLKYDQSPDFRGRVSEAEINAALSGSVKVFGINVGMDGSVGVRSDAEDERRIGAFLELDTNFLDIKTGVLAYDNNIVLGDDVELYIEAGADIILSPSVRLYYSPKSTDFTVEGSLSQDVKITDTIALQGSVGVGSTQVQSSDRELYYKAAITAVHKVSDSTALFIGVDATTFDNIQLSDVEVGVYGGVTHRF